MHKQKRKPKITRFLKVKTFKVKARWGKITFPFIKRIFDSILSQDLIAVQPMMEEPNGMFFYYDKKINPKYYSKIKI